MTRDDLPPDARELFRNARQALDPSPEDLERLHGRVRAAIAGGTAAGVLALAKTGGAAGGGAATATVVLATVAGSVLTWWAISRPRDHREAARALASPVVRVAHVAPAPLSVAPPARPDVPEVPAAAPTSRVIQVAHPRAAREHVERRDTPVAAVDTLESELAIVRSAEDAMAAHDPARALEIVRDAHVTQLAAELAAIEIDALCALGQHELAHTRAAAFLARWPHAALRDRVERSCAGGGEP